MASRRRSSAAVRKLIESATPEQRELNGRYCSLIINQTVMGSQELRNRVDSAYRAKDLAGLRELMDELAR